MTIGKAIKTMELMLDRLEERLPKMPLDSPARCYMIAERNAMEMAAVVLREKQFEIHKRRGNRD